MDSQPVMACPCESVTELTKFSNLRAGLARYLASTARKGSKDGALSVFEQPRCFCPWNEQVKEMV